MEATASQDHSDHGGKKRTLTMALDQAHGVTAGLYEERDSPTKGVGVFAITTIPPGTRILCEPPLLTLPGDDEDVMQCYRAVKALSPEKHAAFWALAASTNSRDDDWIEQLRASHQGSSESFDALVKEHEQTWSKFETNRFTLRASDGSTEKLGVFPNAARFNHSCSPNVYHRFNPNINHLTIQSLRTIHPGEEICTSYIDICHDTTERRRILRHWGFECQCDCCCSETPKSDQNRKKLEDLIAQLVLGERKRLFETWQENEYKKGLLTIEEIIDLMIEEGMEETDTLGEVYATAAEYCLFLGRNEDAIDLAERDLLIERKCCGEDSLEYANAGATLESATGAYAIE